jgi:hypothetical protein
MIMSSAPELSRDDSALVIWLEPESRSIRVPCRDCFSCDAARAILGPRYKSEKLDYCHIKIQRIAGLVIMASVVRIRQWLRAPEQFEVMASVSFPMNDGPMCFARVHPSSSAPNSPMLTWDESAIVEHYVQTILKESTCLK